MFTSLRARLWLTYLLVVGVVVVAALLALTIYLLRNPSVDRRELQRLRLIANLAVQRRPLLALEGTGGGAERLDAAAQRVDASLNVRIAVFDPDGTLLIDSRAGQAAPLPRLAVFTRPAAARTPVLRDDSGQAWLFATGVLANGNVLVVAAPRTRQPVLAVLRDEFAQPIFRALLLALALSLLMALWIARWLSAPLQRLAVAARALSEGEYRPAPLEGPQEVQDVARAFNDLSARLEASQRAQRDLVANVSHDLKTPLTSIQGFAQALLDGTAADPQVARSAAQVIHSEAGRMHRLVLDLLDLARCDAGTLALERRPLDLEALLTGLLRQFAPQAAQAGIDLALEPSDRVASSLTVTGDADRLAQVFANLLDNALKFTPAGGQVRLSTRPTAGDWLEVRVIDGGPGLPSAELERVFERFYQTDKSRRGGSRRSAGLGLAIVREIVAAHGGVVRAENRPNAGGCVFVVRLPHLRPEAAVPGRAVDPVAVASTAGAAENEPIG